MNVKELCSEYDRADLDVSDKKSALENSLKTRSDIVKNIAVSIAPKKKFIRAGREVTIVQRGETFFFRGSKGEGGLLEID